MKNPRSFKNTTLHDNFNFTEMPNETTFLVSSNGNFYSCLNISHLIKINDDQFNLLKCIFSSGNKIEQKQFGISDLKFRRTMFCKQVFPFPEDLDLMDEIGNLGTIVVGLKHVASQLDESRKNGKAPIELNITNIAHSLTSENRLECIALWEYSFTEEQNRNLMIQSPLNVWCRYQPMRKCFSLPTQESIQLDLNRALLCIIYRYFVGNYPWKEWKEFRTKHNRNVSIDGYDEKKIEEQNEMFFFQEVMYNEKSTISYLRSDFENLLAQKLGNEKISKFFCTLWKGKIDCSCSEMLETLDSVLVSQQMNSPKPSQTTQQSEIKDRCSELTDEKFDRYFIDGNKQENAEHQFAFRSSEIARKLLNRPDALHQVFVNEQCLDAKTHQNIKNWHDKFLKENQESEQIKREYEINDLLRNIPQIPPTNSENNHPVDNLSRKHEEKNPKLENQPQFPENIPDFSKSQPSKGTLNISSKPPLDFFSKGSPKPPNPSKIPQDENNIDINTGFFSKKSTGSKMEPNQVSRHCLQKLKDLFSQYPTKYIMSFLDSGEQYLCTELDTKIQNLTLPDVNSPNEVENSWFNEILFPLLDNSSLLYSNVAIKSFQKQIDEQYNQQIEDILFSQLPSIFEEFQWFRSVIMIPFKTKVDLTKNDFHTVDSQEMYESDLRGYVYSIQNYGLYEYKTGNLLRKVHIKICS